jgi:hypothetical protein
MKALNLLILSLLFLGTNAYALAPVESLALGDFSNDYSESKSDPLNYVFTKDSKVKNISYRKELAIYRGMYEEGKNTEKYCREIRGTTYANDWEKTQVKRSTMALIQYIGLDLITRALPLYAKELEYTRDEYVNMVDGLVGNYCSANLSVISKRELLNNFYIKFDKENTFKLPSIAGNPFFPADLDSYLPPKKAKEQEFLYTVKLFQSLCSWGGNPNNPGLLVPILKNSSIMSFIARQMSNNAISWNEISNNLFLKEDTNTLQVWCENLVCRKVTADVFMRKFFYSIGGTSVNEDLKRLYCEDFRMSEYKPKESDPRLAKIMKTMSFDEENFINSQFIALITGIPDFLLRAEKFSSGTEFLRSNVDSSWNKWANTMTSTLNKDLLYEDSLSLEVIPFEQYTNRRSSKLKVAFDVNLGEFDRINQRNGKLRVAFKIKVPNSYMRYYRRALQEVQYNDLETKPRLENRLRLQLQRDIEVARKNFNTPPWPGGLEYTVASEITSQIIETPEKYMDFNKPGDQEIEIELNYGVFALKYFNHQAKIKKNNEKNVPGTSK